jgi:hypothetical protein
MNNFREPTISVTLRGQGEDGEFTFEAMTDEVVKECKYCGEGISYAKTRKGKWVPFDPGDDENTPCDVHFNTCSGRG